MAQPTYLDEYGQLIYPDDEVYPNPGVEAPWIPPNADFGNNPSGDINNQNPTADPNQPFVQEGDTGGYIDNIGVTIGAGSSITPAQKAAYIAEALAAGVPQSWIDGFISANPNDYNRLTDAYFSDAGSEDTRVTGGTSGGSGGGGGGGGGGTNQRPLDPPGPFVAPPYTAPVWNQPPPYVAPIFEEPAPWTYAEFTAPTLEQAKQEPGYQFAMEQGQKALEMSAAARGTLNTGGTLKDLIGYGQAMGEQNYNNVFNRTRDIYGENKNLSKSIWEGEWGAGGTKRTKFDYDTAGGLAQYNAAFNASKLGHEALVHSAEQEYEPIYNSAYQSYLTSFNVWKELFDAAQELEQDND